MTPADAVLTAAQLASTQRVLAEESSRREHVVVSLSGAHAYGFPSPDSDVDVKAVHAAPARELLGFPKEHRAAERLITLDGVEVDYSSNELGAVLQGVLKGNGNYLERFLGPLWLASSPAHESLRALVQGSLSVRLARHYLGFATQQRKEWEASCQRSAKKLLYVLRTALTGTHALLTGELVIDVTQLLERYGFGEAMALVLEKRRGEKQLLPEALSQTWARRLPDVFALLERAEATSALPEAAVNEAALEAWLIDYRRARL